MVSLIQNTLVSLNQERVVTLNRNQMVRLSEISNPATTESSDGKTKIITTTTAIEFNPVLTGDDWKTP